MSRLAVSTVLLFSLLVAVPIHAADYCSTNAQSLNCQTPEKLHSMIVALTKEIHEMKDAQDLNCTVCWSSPCLNGGTCTPLSVTQYRCDCPVNYAGTRCEKLLECTPTTCGLNAVCYIANHQINCVCNQGFAGNPYTGCTMKTKKSCFSGDPHYTTFDGQYYDYMGTCPYIYSKPCSGKNVGPYDYFEVKAKNELLTPGAHVSYVRELEVLMYNQIIHVDWYMNAFLNGNPINMPHVYPNANQPDITISYNNYVFTITNSQHISVTFSPYNTFVCIEVPDDGTFNGPSVLCGLAGNIDNNCGDDFVFQDGTVHQVGTCNNRFLMFTEDFGDSWITNDFMDFVPGVTTCLKGTEVTDGSLTCDVDAAKKRCMPVLNAKDGTGIFAKCQGLQAGIIENAYDDCTYDTCNGLPLCDAFAGFAHLCQQNLPNTQLGWRDAAGCQLQCPLHSTYKECATGCPQTCASPDYNQHCTAGCLEGCECEPGYLLDNGDPKNQACVKLEDCGCKDNQGNYHKANQPWLSDDCATVSVCQNGQLHTENKPCGADATCTVNGNRQRQCVCNQGYEGDGYQCSDIDECASPQTCSAGRLQGVCTNLPGSYHCVCHPYYDDGKNCDTFLPLRQCADLFVYHKQTTDGVYTIKPAYAVAGRPAFDAVKVYCDMTTNGGGWTMMSSSAKDSLAEKTYAEYTDGFGDPALQDVWLGLEIIHQMTKETDTSLRLDITRCPTRGQTDHKKTDCTYPVFKVLDDQQDYAVVLPEYCVGSEVDVLVATGSDDGWWYADNFQPKFAAVDKDDENDCSKKHLNTGWWYDTNHDECGAADLNGVRYDCANKPSDSEHYLDWNGKAIEDVKLYLRPAAFPKYDTPVTGYHIREAHAVN